MGLTRRKRQSKGDIDISPLIDVVFILLIFFMVTTTFIKDAQIPIDRPSSQSGAQASTEALRVYLAQEGDVYIDDAPVKPWMIQSRVRDFLRDSGEGAVLVVADRRVVAEKLIEVVDQIRLAGAKDVGVITDVEAG